MLLFAEGVKFQFEELANMRALIFLSIRVDETWISAGESE